MGFTIHPAALAMPEMPPGEFAELVESIRENGLLVDIELLDGEVLDGRHRQAACEAAGVPPRYIDLNLEGMTPAEYVWQTNGVRRHLTASQKAAIAAELLPQFEVAARERQSHGRTAPGQTLTEKIPEASRGEAREQAAATVGVNARYVSDAKRIREAAPETFEQVKRGDLSLSQARAHVANNTGYAEWYTPRNIIEAARATMGEIDLDPASCETAQTVVNARRFYTEADDGLTGHWAGRVWLNPPYGTSLLTGFVEKLIAETEAGAVTQSLTLTNNATETAWGQKLLRFADAVCFVSGRVRFLNADLQPASSPLQGQVITYAGDRVDAFLAAFESIGYCVPLPGR